MPDVAGYGDDVMHLEEARILWRTHVPSRGQATTVQGELLRAVEKLRDEAQRNGNINWRDDHVRLTDFVRDTLVASKLFDVTETAEIDRDVERLRDFEHPETEDAPYDRLADRVVEWSHAHPTPVAREMDPHLHI